MSSGNSMPHFTLFLLAFSLTFNRLFAHLDTLLDEMEPVKEEDAGEYLTKFGYTTPSQMNVKTEGMAGDLSNVFETAVKAFQEFAHLPVTGVLDVKTRKKMAEPRCGMQDGVEMLTEGGGAAFKWKKSDLTYTFHNFSPDLPRNSVREAIRKAFGIWAAVTPLNFREVTPPEQADINIKFANGMHDDPWPFDKKGGVLAHATMPSSGMLHFDEAENWVYMDAAKIRTHKYTDILPVAIHEGGHALGLSHSKAEESIMAPFYQEQVDGQGNYIYPELKPDDIRAIQAIYGPRKSGKVNQHQQEGEEEQQRKATHSQNTAFNGGETGDGRGGTARTGQERHHHQQGEEGEGGTARTGQERHHQGEEDEGGTARTGQERHHQGEEGSSLGRILVDKGKKALKNMFISWLNNRRRR